MNYAGPNIKLECQKRRGSEHTYGDQSFVKCAEVLETELAIEDDAERRESPYRAVSEVKGRYIELVGP